jgi:hypothetical protein
MVLALFLLLFFDGVDPPADQKELFRASARGVQVYTCEVGGDGSYLWVLDHPEAELMDEKGQNIGRHFAGPNWEMIDGSRVGGHVVARKASPDGSIPWMLLEASAHAGYGMVQHAEYIQRIDTKGGVPDKAGCDTAHVKARVRVPYTATYVFFRAALPPAK